jgi:hypothetical protein
VWRLPSQHYLHGSDTSGFGIDINETLAAK